MKMHDLGYTYEDMGKSSPVVASSSEADKTKHYPHLSLNEKNLKALGKLHCEVGEEYIGTFRVKVTSQREDEYGSGIEFAVTQMSDLSKTMDGSENVLADDKEEEEEE